MAAGVDADFGGTPWIFSFNGTTASHTLPYVVVGPQGTGANLPYPIIPKRIRWVSPTAAAGDRVILKDVPANGGTARVIHESQAATGADFLDEARPRAHEAFVGLQITRMDSGTLYIYW